MSEAAELTYSVVEHFRSIQGEGTHTGVPMTFIRFRGCSVGKKICHGCDTAFEEIDFWRGGGMLSIGQILDLCDKGPRWVSLTGGEPLDQPHLLELIGALIQNGSRTDPRSRSRRAARGRFPISGKS